MWACRSHLARLNVPPGKTFIIVGRQSIGMKCTAEEIDRRAWRGQKKMGHDNANERSDAAAEPASVGRPQGPRARRSVAAEVPSIRAACFPSGERQKNSFGCKKVFWVFAPLTESPPKIVGASWQLKLKMISTSSLEASQVHVSNLIGQKWLMSSWGPLSNQIIRLKKPLLPWR